LGTNKATTAVAADLETLQTEMRSLLDECIEIAQSSLDSKLLNTALERNNLTSDTFIASLESYVMENTYELVYFQISKDLGEKDASVASCTIKLQDIDLMQLGLPPELGYNLMMGVSVSSF
jgi:hypothetical protein